MNNLSHSKKVFLALTFSISITLPTLAENTVKTVDNTAKTTENMDKTVELNTNKKLPIPIKSKLSKKPLPLPKELHNSGVVGDFDSTLHQEKTELKQKLQKPVPTKQPAKN